MERKDLLNINGKIFTGQGQAIEKNAASDVRVLVDPADRHDVGHRLVGGVLDLAPHDVRAGRRGAVVERRVGHGPHGVVQLRNGRQVGCVTARVDVDVLGRRLRGLVRAAGLRDGRRHDDGGDRDGLTDHAAPLGRRVGELVQHDHAGTTSR